MRSVGGQWKAVAGGCRRGLRRSMCLQPGLLCLQSCLVGSVHGLSMVHLVLDVVQLGV